MTRVNIEKTSIDYNHEGSFESNFSKDLSIAEQEINVFYKDLFEEEQKGLPVSIFSQELSPLQAIVRYLKEQGLSFSEIGRRLGRDPRTIWTAHNQAKDKPLHHDDSSLKIPVSIFAERTLSTLESLVEYLLKTGFAVKEIAETLDKDYRTIWTIKCRIARKRGGADE